MNTNTIESEQNAPTGAPLPKVKRPSRRSQACEDGAQRDEDGQLTKSGPRQQEQIGRTSVRRILA